MKKKNMTEEELIALRQEIEDWIANKENKPLSRGAIVAREGAKRCLEEYGIEYFTEDLIDMEAEPRAEWKEYA